MLFPNRLAYDALKMLVRISLQDVSTHNKFLFVKSYAFLFQNNALKRTVSVWRYATIVMEKDTMDHALIF